MSDLIDVLHWLRPSNWAGVESDKAAQTLVVITELRAEVERLRAENERLNRHLDDFAARWYCANCACVGCDKARARREALEGGGDDE
ncbi:hypothetical protein K0U83_03635 [bacterium]|nr:hypothetical protein [bacterium]